jgi:hypothetical protein
LHIYWYLPCIEQEEFQVPWGHNLHIDCTMLKKKTGPWGPPATISLGTESSPSTKTLNFLFVRKETISFMRLVENSNSDNLYGRLGCHIVSKAFLMLKNTITVDILLLKFRVTRSVNLTQWSVMLWWAWKLNWMYLASSLPQRVFGLFLKPASQKVCSQWTRSWSVINLEKFWVLDRFQQIYDFCFFQRWQTWQSKRQ